MSDRVELLPDEEDFRIYIADFDQESVKQFNCHSGMRAKCAAYDLSWWDFLTNGIMFSELAALEDGQVNRCLVEILNGRRRK
ncbi:tail assembly chaperone [Vibrio phage VpP2 MP]